MVSPMISVTPESVPWTTFRVTQRSNVGLRPKWRDMFRKEPALRSNGGYSKGDPPLTIPNREVKPLHADGTAARWESR
jgi:hypothetical protein